MFKKVSEETEKQSQTLPDFKRQLEERSKPIDTLMLQLESLYNFAGKLGYNIRGSYYVNRGFYNPNAPQEDLKFISFDVMKYWHNNPFQRYSFSNGGLNIAAAAEGRIVETVKLQRTKKGVKVQSHYVKLVTESVEDYRMCQLAKVCPSLSPAQLTILVESGLLK